MENKIRKCPYCKSKKGYEYNYSITGHGSEKRDFEGNVMDAHRETFDDVDEYTIFCLNCNSKLDIKRLDL